MTLTYGALFAGYGGLEVGVQSVLGGTTSWVAEFDKHASAIHAHNHPNIPNLGDVTKIDWHTVEPVDVITGGSPCQDLSHAGKRQGMRPGTRSGLWAAMHDAITIIRPRLVVWENVRGALSAEANSDLEHCPGCMGDPRDGVPPMRALGRVVSDLADIGYVGSWHGLRAADVGAPHGRFRVFLYAWPAGTDPVSNTGSGGGHETVQHNGRRPQSRDGTGVPHESGRHPVWARPERGDVTLLPTPVSDNSRGLPSTGTDYQSLPNAVVALLPTPRATDGTKGGPNQAGSSGDLMLPSAVQPHRLLPTPSAADAAGGNRNIEHRRESGSQMEMSDVVLEQDRWGDYAAAIARWETILGRPAPAPTEPGTNSNPRLAAPFVEFMMGLPEGHVTHAPISRANQLKALGNGVVPQQAAAATRALFTTAGDAP